MINQEYLQSTTSKTLLSYYRKNEERTLSDLAESIKRNKITIAIVRQLIEVNYQWTEKCKGLQRNRIIILFLRSRY